VQRWFHISMPFCEWMSLTLECWSQTAWVGIISCSSMENYWVWQLVLRISCRFRCRHHSRQRAHVMVLLLHQCRMALVTTNHLLTSLSLRMSNAFFASRHSLRSKPSRTTTSFWLPLFFKKKIQRKPERVYYMWPITLALMAFDWSCYRVYRGFNNTVTSWL
jgi:hypothetical protein